MASLREIRSIRLQIFGDGDISEDEVLLPYDVNISKNPDFPHESYGKFDLNDIDDSECFVFVRVTFPSFLRPYILLTTLHVDKEQYAMELKGYASHFEGLGTHVDSVI